MSGFVSTSHICSVSTKLATFPSASAPRQWWRTPWRARATRATTETTANVFKAASEDFFWSSSLAPTATRAERHEPHTRGTRNALAVCSCCCFCSRETAFASTNISDKNVSPHLEFHANAWSAANHGPRAFSRSSWSAALAARAHDLVASYRAGSPEKNRRVVFWHSAFFNKARHFFSSRLSASESASNAPPGAHETASNAAARNTAHPRTTPTRTHREMTSKCTPEGVRTAPAHPYTARDETRGASAMSARAFSRGSRRRRPGPSRVTTSDDALSSSSGTRAMSVSPRTSVNRGGEGSCARFSPGASPGATRPRPAPIATRRDAHRRPAMTIVAARGSR